MDKKYQSWSVTDWRKVLFSNESHFLVQGQHSQHVRRSIREPISECHIDQTVKHPQKKMLCGSFTYYGVGPLLPIKRIMNIEKYIQVLDKKVVRDLSNALPHGSGIFQQDSAQCIRPKR